MILSACRSGAVSILSAGRAEVPSPGQSISYLALFFIIHTQLDFLHSFIPMCPALPKVFFKRLCISPVYALGTLHKIWHLPFIQWICLFCPHVLVKFHPEDFLYFISYILLFFSVSIYSLYRNKMFLLQSVSASSISSYWEIQVVQYHGRNPYRPGLSSPPSIPKLSHSLWPQMQNTDQVSVRVSVSSLFGF